MKGPFIRACRKHGCEIEDHTVIGAGREKLWCPAGHPTRSWVVVDSEGKTLAVAFVNESPRIVSRELARMPKLRHAPEKLCSRGHFEWFLESNEYRCRICRREQSMKKFERYKERKKNV